MLNYNRQSYIDRINSIYSTFILNGDLFIKYPGNKSIDMDPRIDNIIRTHTLVEKKTNTPLSIVCPTANVICYKKLIFNSEAFADTLSKPECFKYFSANYKDIVGGVYKFPLAYINDNKMILLKNYYNLIKILKNTYDVFVNYIPVDPNNVAKYEEKARFFNRFCYKMRNIIDTVVKVFDLYMPKEEKILNPVEGGNLYIEEIPSYTKMLPEKEVNVDGFSRED